MSPAAEHNQQPVSEKHNQGPSGLIQSLRVATLLGATLPAAAGFLSETATAADRQPAPAVTAGINEQPIPAIITEEQLAEQVKAAEALISEASAQYEAVKAMFPDRNGPLLQSRLQELNALSTETGNMTREQAHAQYGEIKEKASTWRDTLIAYQQAEVHIIGVSQELQDSTLIPFSYRVEEKRLEVERQLQKAQREWEQAEPAYGESLQKTDELLGNYRQVFVASRAEVRTISREVNQLNRTLDTLRKSEYAEEIPDLFKTAEENIRIAKEAYKKGDSSFFTRADQAKVSVAEVQDGLERAETFAGYQQMALIAAGVLGALGLGGGLIAGSRAGKAYRSAEEMLGREKEEVESFERRFLSVYRRAEASDFDFGSDQYGGVTRGAADSVREKLGSIMLHVARLQSAVGKADGLLHEQSAGEKLRSLLSPTQAQSAANVVSEVSELRASDVKKITIGAEGEQIELAFPPRVKSISTDIATSKAAIHEGLVRVEEILSNFENKRDTLEKSLVRQDELLATLRSDHHALLSGRKGIPEFRIGELTRQTVKGFLQKSQELKRIGARDPLRAVEYADVMERRIKNLTGITAVCLEAATDCGVDIKKAAGNLNERGFQSDWIDTRLGVLSSMALEAANVARQGKDPEAELLREQVYALEERVYEVIEATEKFQQQKELLEEIGSKVAPVKQRVAEVCGISPEEALNNEELRPEELLSEASGYLAQTNAALNAGDCEGASISCKEAEALINRANNSLSVIEETLVEFKDVFKSREGTQEELADQLKIHDNLYKELTGKYLEAAFVMGKGDSSHPAPERTLGDYLGEANELLEFAAAGLKKSNEAFDAGRILTARHEMEHIFSLHEVTYSRFDELFVKEDRLQRQDKINSKNLLELTSIAVAVNKQAEQSWVPESVVKEAAALFDNLNSLQLEHDKSPRDPEALREAILDLADTYRNVQHGILEARFTKLSAEKLVHSLFEFHKEIEAELQTKENQDAILRRQFGVACSQQAALEQMLKEPHQEWRQIEDAGFNTLTNSIKIFGVLTEDEEIAGRLNGTISEAKEERDRLLQWKGEYGVRVRGNPGAEPFEEAIKKTAAGNLYMAEYDAREALSAVKGAADMAAGHVEREKQKFEARQAALETEKKFRSDQEEQKQAVINYSRGVADKRA